MNSKDLSGFRSSFTIICTSLGEEMAKNEK